MNIIEIPVNQLKPYKKNARFNENAVPKVAESIRQFGFKVPIVVDKNMVVITGHTRLASAKQLGLEKVPCIIADDLTPKQVKAFRLVDNRTSEFASWNYDLLQTELESLDIDLSDFEFPDLTYEDTMSADELESILDDNTDATDYGNKGETETLPVERKEEYKVEITCKNQTEQESLYYELVKRGLNVRTYLEDSRRGGRGSSTTVNNVSSLVFPSYNNQKYGVSEKELKNYASSVESFYGKSVKNATTEQKKNYRQLFSNELKTNTEQLNRLRELAKKPKKAISEMNDLQKVSDVQKKIVHAQTLLGLLKK